MSSPYRDAPGGAAPPNVLICSALDPSGGAGFLADASVVRAFECRPVGVLTALTVQDTRGMRSCHELDHDVVGAQLSTLLTDVEVRAVKLGILGSAAVVRELGEHLALTAAPVVWDPVMAPTQGEVTFSQELFRLALEVLGPHLTLITPNSVELGALIGTKIRTLDEAIEGAKVFAQISNVAVLVKGGHFGSRESVVDVLCHSGGIETYRGPRLPGPDVHGTGCVLSAAIASQLARGLALQHACSTAKKFLYDRIAHPVLPGRGAPAAM